MPYRLPDADSKARYVRERFDAIARRYDLFNDLITQGQHRWWKRTLVRRLRLRPGARVLDLCCGTADIAARIRAHVGVSGRVVAADFSGEMLRFAARRLRAAPGGAALTWLAGADATRLPFADGAFDAVSIGYGLRNVNDLPACLAEVRRVLKRGGRMASLDVGKVRAAWMRPFVDAYFFHVVPLIGQLIQPGEEMYTYLPHSSVDYPQQDRLKAILAESGYTDVELIEYLGGASVIHVARRAG
jgi:demethylmenaquinone methyltransferase/2-methoxy-6-polyprenyl-1,4-benzoquinol methylase